MHKSIDLKLEVLEAIEAPIMSEVELAEAIALITAVGLIAGAIALT
jgi:hypothetical protein